MARILIIGGSGQTGKRLRSRFPGETVLAPSHSDLDLGDEPALRGFLRSNRFDSILIPGGMTRPAECEADPERAMRINGIAPGMVAEEARGAHVIFFSTDYVFDGKEGPYPEEATPNPIGVYGASKREGELRVQQGRWTVIRTCHVFSHDPGGNFFMHVVRNLAEGKQVKAYVDQFSTPTDAETLADETARVVNEGREGILHLAGNESCSRYEFATEIARLLGREGVEESRLPDDGRPARVGLVSHLPSWKEGVFRHLTEFRRGLDKQ